MKRWIAMLLAAMMIVMCASAVSATEGDGILKIGITEEPDTLNPFIAYERGADEAFMVIYDSLVAKDEALETIPSLAKSWEVSEDGLVWTFKLRDDVKWSDGEQFTADDVKWTYDKILETGLSMYYDSMKGIDEVVAADDYTIEFKCAKPKANMLLIYAPILPEHIWSTLSNEELELNENSNPVGTGSFIFQEWKPGEYLSFKRNDNYFGGAPKANGLIYVVYASRETMAQAFKNGEIDVTLGLYMTQAKNAITDSTEVFNIVERGFSELAFNCSPDMQGNPMTLDKYVRQAFELAIDKQKIIDMVYEGEGLPGTSIISPSDPFYHYAPEPEVLRSYNPEKAMALLDEHGYTDQDGDGVREDESGNKMEFLLLLRSGNTMEVKAGQMIMSNLKDVGVTVNIETLDDGALADRIYMDLDYDMFIWGWGADLDPSTILAIFLTENIGGLNDSYYSNPEFDALLEEQRYILDEDERREVVLECQRILYEDAPYIVMIYGKELQLVNKDKVSGIVSINGGAPFYSLTKLNYLNAVPTGATAAAAAVAEVAESATGSPTIIIVVVIVIAVILVAVFMLMRKNKGGGTKGEW